MSKLRNTLMKVLPHVSKDERALLVVVNFSTGGEPRFQWLYEWMDANAVVVAELMMKPHYRHIDTLTGDNVTSSNFVNRIISLAQDPQTKVLDVFLNLHGSPGTLHFDDGSITSSDLKSQLQAANLKNRLRLLYSTACYGANHAPDFVGAGFRVASGAVGVNANQVYDYPLQLYHWGTYKTYESAVKAGNNPALMKMQDTLARAFFGDDVNSEKIIEGKKHTRISSEAI